MVVGLEGVVVEVEMDYSNGLPAVIIVGLPDPAVQESRERVQTAVKNAYLHFPRHRIVINLSPVSIRKEGPAYDLPIALGVIILSGRLTHEVVQNTLVIGELSTVICPCGYFQSDQKPRTCAPAAVTK